MEHEILWMDRYVRFGFIAKEWFHWFHHWLSLKPNACAHIQQNTTPVEFADSLNQLLLSPQPRNTIANAMLSMCSTCYAIFMAKSMNSPYVVVREGSYALFNSIIGINLHRYYWNYSNLWQGDHGLSTVHEGIKFLAINMDTDFETDCKPKFDFSMLRFAIITINRSKPHHWKYMILRKGLLDDIIKIA